ncbi:MULTISPECIES: winged helix-turn-helix domain-containing protein [Paraburkholderia]|uniref:Winged helix-turn-helix domain-containing protein n=1 Tax=Paraburkholderia madseniana TaxID=2599607 RepID=A0AAP5EZQ1_9BURK|nr:MULTISPECIES: winged helix-turn-helix domain-containing protein [Paraburkholderia]MCX4149849.1 winged helix-turn-helix domain-containing protein [Paraburkholderia madseniana]MDN7152785.1 winged helix-turn-helix domain-containing protein [Paraburkholderia sp. WS6]MDQ6411667.1 winged helix-turn-helix domain-containing protein [Paraburkholderia madseniana]
MAAFDRPLNLTTGVMELGRFRVDLGTRELRRDGVAIPVGSRAFDILAVLVSAGGRLVTKNELMSVVWPQTIVEENNIHVHLSALRKILGPDRNLVLTVPGRGYQLCVQKTDVALTSWMGGSMRDANQLPSNIALVGRETAVQRILAMLESSRLITLVGAGGIGKTRLSLEVARRTEEDSVEPAYFVDLSGVTTREGMLDAIMKGCGRPTGGAGVPEKGVACALSDLRGLLFIDNAEHLIAHVAEIVDALLAANNHVRVVVTSRERLRISPEHTFKVDPLETPPAYTSQVDIRGHSAVRLFLQRANAMQLTVGADGQQLQLVGEICRRLDGIPLAIELAAARVAALGLDGARHCLDDRMAFLTGGYRTARPRHQSLRATFDWSHALLDHTERTLFRRTAVFDGLFTLEALGVVAYDATLSLSSAIAGIDALVAKSLLNVQFEGPRALYWLYESTRAYALQKLRDEGEVETITMRHEHHAVRLPRRAGADQLNPEPGSVRRSSPTAGHHALNWSAAQYGDIALR